MSREAEKNWIYIIPPIGIIIYFILFYVAATLYPGGSKVDLNSLGYDWINNYWCDLYPELAMNGEPNAGRFFAVTAMVIICLSLALFFYLFSKSLMSHRVWKKSTKYLGVADPLCAIFIFTPYHYTMLLLALVMSVLPLIGVVNTIVKSDFLSYKRWGVVVLLLITATIAMYYGKIFIVWLPLVQKITFIFTLLWVGELCLKLYRQKLAL
ncbi:hypothetical protein OAD66_00185 [Bacteroidia bacterium]|nr:hypothetical protein [Bacteroidia bacterium]MDB9881544.1 hypothetical protein [Bacteroidia bacterium]